MNDSIWTATAWWGKWFMPKVGKLTLEGQRLSFQVGEQLEFDVPLEELQELTWHWYSFSAAFETTVRGKPYFLSFLGPGNTLGSWWRGLQRGRQWRAEMTARLAHSRQ
jgi:hypothetical protein